MDLAFQLPWAASGTRRDILVGDFNSDGVTDFGIPNQGFYTGVSVVTLYLSQPAIDAFPSQIHFRLEKVGGTSKPKPIHLTNTGNAALKIRNIRTSGDFLETNNCGTELAIGRRCEIEVSFKPTAPGLRRGSILLESNATNGEQELPLAGNGK